MEQRRRIDSKFYTTQHHQNYLLMLADSRFLSCLYYSCGNEGTYFYSVVDIIKIKLCGSHGGSLLRVTTFGKIDPQWINHCCICVAAHANEIGFLYFPLLNRLACSFGNALHTHWRSTLGHVNSFVEHGFLCEMNKIKLTPWKSFILF